MKKSLIALLVVLALVITVSAFSVSADEPAPASADYTLTITDGVATAACPCPTHNGQVATFTEYTASSALSNGAHYYLSGNVAHTANRAVSTNHTAVIHLNGNTLSCSSNYVFNNWNENTNLYLVADATKGGVVSTSRTHAAVRSSVGNVYSYNVTYTRAAGSPPSGFAGGTIAQQGAGEFHMYGGTINGVVASGNGGAVQITSGTFHMHSGTIQNCSATSGGAVYIGGGTFHMHGGTITGCSASNGGAVYIGGGTFKMAGGDITSCSATTGNGGAVYISGANSKIEMSDGTISNCTAAKSAGGAIYIQYQSTANTFSGGTIQNCSAANGGAVYISGSGSPKLTMSGTAMIDTCSATSGAGAVHIAGNTKGAEAHFEMQNGTIQNCSSPTGGGVRVNGNSIFTMSNGLVTANRSTSSFGGNVRVDNANAIFNISGGTISDGVTAGNGGNLFCNQAAVLNITGGTFSGGSATAEGGNICITNAATTSVMKNAKISGGTSTGTGKSIGAALCLMTGNFSEISGMTFEGGSTASAANTSGAGVLITSGSYTIKNSTFTGGTAYTNGGALLLATSGTTTLEGCTVSGGVARYGSNIYISTGTLNLVDTDIKNNNVAVGTQIHGGGIYVGAATVNMDAKSTISGCHVMHGASVTLSNASAVFNLNGGTISDGQATRNSTTLPYGGNIYVHAGTFNMNSGTISGGKVNNTTTTNGGGYGGNVYIDGGEFKMFDGIISGGQHGNMKGSFYGGNVAVRGGTFTMEGGTITEGTTKTQGGNVYIMGVDAENLATFTMEDGTISKGTSSDNQGGICVADYGVFTMKDGLIDDNDSVYAGGNIGVQSSANDIPATLTITGGTISNGDSTSGDGGNLLISTGAVANISNATISGGTVVASGKGGGNVKIEGNAQATFTGCEITGGRSADGVGGNISIVAAGASFTGCEITGGIAGTKVVDEETGAIGTIATDGRGGNVATNQDTTFTNCVFRNGESWGEANPGGGNIYIYGGDNQILDGCTITGGFAYKTGGNIVLHGTPTVYIKGDSYIAGGEAYTGWGGNIGYTNSAKLHLQGNTEVDGKDAYCASGYHYGNNVGMSNALSVAHELHVEENAVIKNGDHTGKGENINRYSVVVAPATDTAVPKIYLSGNGSIDKIFLRGNNSTSLDNIVVLKEGYTGSAQVLTNYAAYNESVVPGANVYAVVTMDGYTGTGSLKVLDASSTGFITYVDSGVLKVAGVTGFKGYNVGTDDEYTVETGFATLDAVVDAGYDYAKLYKGGIYTLSAKTDNFPIDLNNQVVTINTGSYKLAPIDWRTDGNVVGRTQLTVDTDANVVLRTQNPINKYQYLNVKVTDGESNEYWTSNRVTVKLTKVSIKTAKDGIYYTTKIGTNANAAPYLVDYGTAVSLVENVVIDENFLDYLDTNGVLYTAFELDKTGNFSTETRSALVSGILSEENDAATNTAHAQMDITANSFVTAMVNGTEVKIMADEAHVLSFEDIMIKLDDKVEELNRLQPDGFDKTIATAVAFYNKWADTFGTWANLPNLKAEAAKAA